MQAGSVLEGRSNVCLDLHMDLADTNGKGCLSKGASCLQAVVMTLYVQVALKRMGEGGRCTSAPSTQGGRALGCKGC